MAAVHFPRFARQGLGTVIFSLLCATSAWADCDSGHAGATQLFFDISDKDTFLGLEMSLNFGLSPESFPKDDIAKNARACPRGSFVVRDDRYSLLGTQDSMPERWAELGQRGEVAYLAELPKPPPALAWLRAHPTDNNPVQFKPDEMMIVLAVTAGGSRKVFAYFNTMPDDATASRALCGALTGQLAELGSYDAATAVTSFTGARQTPIGAVSGCSLLPGNKP